MYYLLVIALLLSLVSAHAEMKRTASGKPDLTGTYDTGTLTPLERPKEFGNNKFMTREDAEKVVADAEAFLAFANRETSGDREAPPKGGDGNNRAGAGNVGGYNAFWVDRGDDVFEIDGKFRTSIIYAPENGRRPPMTREAMASTAARFQSFAHDNDGTASWLAHAGPGPFDGPESLAPSERCLISFGSTVPTLPSLYNNYKRIVQTDEYVMILQEMVHDARIIRMNAEHSPEGNRKWMGDSVGRWEGDVLVVETRNFKGASSLAGADKDLHVVERYSLMPDGNVLYDFTVNNPTVWTAPWSGEYVWRSSPNKVYEYACHEGNYAMGNVLRGARLLESEWEGEIATDAGEE